MTDPRRNRFATAIEHFKGHVVISVRGDIDLSAEAKFAETLATAIGDRPGRITVDLSAVEFMDSSGVRCLLLGKRSADAAAIAFAVRGAQGVAAQVLKITGVFDLLTAVPAEPASEPVAAPSRWSWLKR